MGKHLDKMQRALAQRQAATYASGQKNPGSMNIKKTGYRGQKAKGSKQCFKILANGLKTVVIKQQELHQKKKDQLQIFVTNAGIKSLSPNKNNIKIG